MPDDMTKRSAFFLTDFRKTDSRGSFAGSVPTVTIYSKVGRKTCPSRASSP
jgi:hypothetical protein